MSEKEWLRDVSVCAVHGDSAWYVCYETKTHRLRLTHRGTWSRDDMDIYWKSQAEAFAALHVAPCPLEDPYSRISALESTIARLREVAAEQHAWEEMAERCGLRPKPHTAEKDVMALREAVKVLAVGIAPLVGVTDEDDICLTWDAAQNIRIAMDNPIAAAAVREAGK